MLADDANIDVHILPAEMLHVVDSDSSQTLAVHDVRKGRSLVIQGPPGTGKSQTIANVIASAVADGKTVLFVAEKMAALDVVKRRLNQAGVGDACLELHSNKANKRILLDELRRTWELGSPRGEFPSSLTTRLENARDDLNAHAERMHSRHAPSELSPYHVLGQLVRLRQAGQRPVDLTLGEIIEWTPDDLGERQRLLLELCQRVDEIGLPLRHPWNGVGLDVILPTTLERLVPKIEELKTAIDVLRAELTGLARSLECPDPVAFDDVTLICKLADILASAPDLSANALTASIWDERADELRQLLLLGSNFERMAEELGSVVTSDALLTPVDGLEAELAWLPREFSPDAFGRAGRLAELLPRLQSDAERLTRELGVTGPIDSFTAVARLVSTGERVGAAPDASPEAFAAAVWDQGVEQAGDLAEAVTTLGAIRAQVGDRLLDVAWNTEVAAARQALAMHTGPFRYLNGDWRRAKALVRSIVRTPEVPLPQLIELLDKLMKGQASAKSIREGEAFGRSAFGADWRGERSELAPLVALVAWMRTLRGLGAEPRLIAGRLAERSEVRERSTQLQRLLDELRPLLKAFWSDLGVMATAAFEDAAAIELANLALVDARARALVAADDLSRRVIRIVPASLPDRLDLIRRLLSWQQVSRAITERREVGQAAFDIAWNGISSDWRRLSDGVAWMALNGGHRHLAARLPERQEVTERARHAEFKAVDLRLRMDELFSSLKTDPHALFGRTSDGALRLAEISERLETWLANTEQLSKWVSYRERADRGHSQGLGNIVDHLADGRLSTATAQSAFEMAYYEAMLAELVARKPELGRFDGNLHTRLAREFANLDLERIKATSLEVVRAHHRRIPSRDGGVGPVGVLRAEMARRRGHMPIRQLMQRAGPAIQAMKPVLMMSPLSVAQFLTPGRMTFDLLVMDEASQIQPVDALGAIARCRQVVVVGDERQLPPTKFFAKMTGGQTEDDDGEGAQVADIESILGLFSARGLPQRMLRWHYRSRHQSLIAVSNSQFYENKLFIVPSPYTQEAGMGLRFHHVPDGVFDSGKTGTNPIEARAVAEAIIRHAKTHPALSLGVATFSVSQRRAIQDELEVLRRLNPDTEDFFHAHPSEPFFVKNLENVQGDERDVIMISVGYAKNAQGYMAMRFGPLGAEGGERRLNVLISRAKRRCEVFSSITDEDIDLERAKGRGVFAFKLFLHYARTGRLSVAQPSGREADSIFEEQVANALQARGYQVHPQVGIAGFFIDLAIADPERPGRYLLGIECDGAAYHSSRSARDRDRLRQAVLEDHGWIIHRIWSTDWFQRPQEQLERTIAAIEAAKTELDERLELGAHRHRAVPVEVVTVERSDVTEIGLADVVEDGLSERLYVEATTIRPGPYDLHETPIGIMADLVEQVVKVESPVHVDEVVARLRTAWGLQRAGGRIQTAVEGGVALATSRGRIKREGRFLSIPQAKTRLRDRRNVMSQGLRKPEMIPASEIAVGVVHVVTTNFGATDDEVALSISRLLGFKATSAQLRTVITQVVDNLLSEGRLVRDGAMLAVATTAAPEMAAAQTDEALARV